MTWAARYSRTEQPELTIYRDGVEVRRVSVERMDSAMQARRCNCGRSWPDWIEAVAHDTDLRADIAARVPVRECIETDACRNHAVDGERCFDHGGSDEL